MLQALAVVGLAGYLSFCNGQQVVVSLASQLAAEVGSRIEQNLANDLRTPAEITRSNAAAIRLGILDWRNQPSLERYFGQQLRIFDNVSSVAIADERQNFLAVKQRSNGSIVIRAQDRATHDNLNQYLADDDGARGKFLGKSGFNAHNDPADNSWYLATKVAQQPIWRLVVSHAEEKNPTLTAVNFQPFFDRANTFQGVLASSVSLAQLHSFLKSLKIGKTGQAFIVERNGLLIANSNGGSPFRHLGSTDSTRSDLSSNGTQRRLPANSSRDFVTQQAAAFLIERFGSFDRIHERQQLSFEVDRQRYFINVEPIGLDQNLDWLAVVVMPEADFLDAIQGNNRFTLLLCAGALTVAIAVGWLTSSWIARPILQLSRVSRALALGDWQHPVNERSKIAELEVLAHSFNQMTIHLQASFDQVKTALQESEERFTKVFRSSPDAISVATLPERRYIEVNDRFLAFSGYTREEVLGQNARSLNLIVNAEQIARFEDLVQTQKRVQGAEIDYRNKLGALRTVLVSSEVIELEGQACLLSMYRDITERKRAEEALYQSEKRFRNAFDTTAVGMALTAPDGRFLQANASLCQMLGYTEAELLTLTFPGITHADDLDATLEYAHKLLADEISYYHLEKRYYHKDGRTIWCLLSVSMARDLQQKPLYFVAQMQDITGQQVALLERQQAEVSMQAANTALNQRVAELSMLNHMTQTVATVIALPIALTTAAALMTDRFQARETTISLLNHQPPDLQTIAAYQVDPQAPSFLSTALLCEADTLVTHVFEQRTSIVFAASDATPQTERLRSLMQTHNLHCLMMVGLQIRGEVVGMITLAAEPVERVFTSDEVRLVETIAGQIAGAVQNAQLFAEVQQAREAAEAANLAKSAFLAAMSHELQTPLAGILDVVQQLEQGQSTRSQQDQLAMIHSNSEHLLQLIHDILAIAAIKATQQDDDGLQ